MPGADDQIVGAKAAPCPVAVSPMLASLAEIPFTRKGWIYEPKMDGIRGIVFINSGKVRILSRRGLDLTSQYPVLAAAFAQTVLEDALIDGEIIALNELGRPSFQHLQQRMNLTKAADVAKAEESVPVYYFAFDVLWVNGHNLTSVKLKDRKDILNKLIPGNQQIHVLRHFTESGIEAYEAAIETGFEGIVAKRFDSPYESGRRSQNWVKVKAQRSAEFLIGGFTPGQGSRAITFGSLLLGFYDSDGKFVYAGSVGTGFDDRGLADMVRRISPLKTKSCPFIKRPEDKRDALWLTPKIVAEIKFMDWTRDGHLRTPVFLRVREDIAPEDVLNVRDTSRAYIVPGSDESDLGDETAAAIAERAVEPAEPQPTPDETARISRLEAGAPRAIKEAEPPTTQADALAVVQTDALSGLESSGGQSTAQVSEQNTERPPGQSVEPDSQSNSQDKLRLRRRAVDRLSVVTVGSILDIAIEGVTHAGGLSCAAVEITRTSFCPPTKKSNRLCLSNHYGGVSMSAPARVSAPEPEAKADKDESIKNREDLTLLVAQTTDMDAETTPLVAPTDETDAGTTPLVAQTDETDAGTTPLVAPTDETDVGATPCVAQADDSIILVEAEEKPKRSRKAKSSESGNVVELRSKADPENQASANEEDSPTIEQAPTNVVTLPARPKPESPYSQYRQSTVFVSPDNAVAAQLGGKDPTMNLIVEGEQIKLTSLSKVIFPASNNGDAITKRDYLRALSEIAPFILPHLRNRPLTLIRSGRGLAGRSFFQKHWGVSLPEFVETVQVTAPDREQEEHLVCNNLASLLFLAQNGVLEFHTWPSRSSGGADAEDPIELAERQSLDVASTLLNYPDYMIFDLDYHPPKDTKFQKGSVDPDAFEKSREAAFIVKETLDAMRMKSFAKLSGKNGIHVVVPVVRNLDFEMIRSIAQTIAIYLTRNHLDKLTLEMEKYKRADRIFLDYHENGRGRTIVSPYSPRAVDICTIAAPVTWEELEAVSPQDFTLYNAGKLLNARPDPWKDILDQKNDLQNLPKK